MKQILLFLLSIASFTLSSQAQKTILANQDYKNLDLSKTDSLVLSINLKRDSIYRFSILQQGIAVYYALHSPQNNKVAENPDIYDISGYERFEYTCPVAGRYTLIIKRYEHPLNPDTGRVSVLAKSLSKKEIKDKLAIEKELAPENAKNVTTVDVDHFWDAFDRLKTCKTYADSADCFQAFYLNKATDGMIDFIAVRDWTAERFVDAVAANRDFYTSVRQKTLDAKQAVPVIEEVFAKFKEIYAQFKPFKVCFAIGIKNTGGTVSDKFVLIGTEVTLGDAKDKEDIVKRIKGMVAHECVHTQQRLLSDTSAIQCPLLWQSLKEGSCDLIAELITGQSRDNEYGNQHEKQLWLEFKNELCNDNFDRWLYNGYASKETPGDLGYYMGYKITKEYYSRATDKRKAISDIINMGDPIEFLQLSRYDQRFR